MRFTGEKKLREAYWNGTRRYKHKFLWWPITIDGETRWLENAHIEYKVTKGTHIFCDTYYYWTPWEFVDPVDQKPELHSKEKSCILDKQSK